MLNKRSTLEVSFTRNELCNWKAFFMIFQTNMQFELKFEFY